MSLGDIKANAPIYHPSVFVPLDVRAIDGTLKWRVPAQTERNNWQRVTDQTVMTFAKLHKKTEKDIAEFGARHGVFGAKLVKPSVPKLPNEIILDGARWAVATEVLSLRDSEPLSVWRFLSRRAFAILRINATLKGKAHNPRPSTGLAEDWRALDVEFPLEDVRDAQFYLCDEVNYWLRSGGVRLALGPLEWSKERTAWKVEINYSGTYNLFGALAYRMFLMVAGERNLYVCDACSELYFRWKRAPRRGQENFCSEDCQTVAMKRATERYREKRRKAK